MSHTKFKSKCSKHENCDVSLTVPWRSTRLLNVALMNHLQFKTPQLNIFVDWWPFSILKWIDFRKLFKCLLATVHLQGVITTVSWNVSLWNADGGKLLAITACVKKTVCVQGRLETIYSTSTFKSDFSMNLFYNDELYSTIQCQTV